MYLLVELVSTVLASKYSVFAYKRFLPGKRLTRVTGLIKVTLKALNDYKVNKAAYTA